MALGSQTRPRKAWFRLVLDQCRGPLNHFDALFIRNRKRMETKGYREDVFFDEAMAFIEECEDQPFFCYLATYSPHTPLAAPEKFIQPFRDAGLNETHSTYLAMIENIDHNLGRLMNFLKETGRDENTIVIMVNDNGVTEGLDVYNAQMRGPKCSAWEGGTRAFSFWRWPGKWKPKALGNLTAHLDVLRPSVTLPAPKSRRPNSKTNSKDTPSAPCWRVKSQSNGSLNAFSTTMWPVGPAVSQNTTSTPWQASDRAIT